ncbi:MAG: polysaccharide deacetylase [Rhodospirillales bacterium]|nr:polysaccharide deacetylase [Rhodospirillales bacterium]
MTLPTHRRFDYVPITRRPDFRWKNGASLAFYIGLNLEHFAFGAGLSAELAAGGPPAGRAQLRLREYGNRVGAWCLLELFKSLDLPCSVLVNAAIYQHCPELPDAFQSRGDEIVGHGRSNSERQGTLDEAAEAALITEATATIARHAGAAPKGWLGPWISQSAATPDLLREAGYEYLLDWCHDDQPVWMRTRGGRAILSVPYPQELNDIPAIVGRKMNADDFADMVVDQFEEMLLQAAAGPALVMGVALHPYIVGQPYRLRHLRRALAHIAGKRDRLWITTAGAVAEHFALVQPPGV